MSFIDKTKTSLSEWWNKHKDTKYGRAINVLKNSVQLFKNHDTFTLGASLSYYMIFSIAPMLIIVISVVGALFGHDAVVGEIQAQAKQFVGNEGAKELQDIIKAAYKPGENTFTTIVALVVLLVGATSVFDQLRKSLDIIWDVKPHVKKPFLRFLVNRVFSFAMIICLAFLLLVTLVLHAGLAAFSHIINNTFSGFSVTILQIFENGLSLVVMTLLFALIYKFMSDAKLHWHSVWWGALFTSFLFSIGKYLISIYIGQTNLADTYGAAGSIVVILVWVFYSSQILFFGAEFTHALAIERGVKLDPVAQQPNTKAGITQKVVLDTTKA
jgi:membrane protein